MTDKIFENQNPELTSRISFYEMQASIVEAVIKNCIKVENVEQITLEIEEDKCLKESLRKVREVFKI